MKRMSGSARTSFVRVDAGNASLLTNLPRTYDTLELKVMLSLTFVWRCSVLPLTPRRAVTA